MKIARRKRYTREGGKRRQARIWRSLVSRGVSRLKEQIEADLLQWAMPIERVSREQLLAQFGG